LKGVKSVVNECCGCGVGFRAIADELFCSTLCESNHNLFNDLKEEKSLIAPVQVSYLTPEELEKYKNQPKKQSPRKPHRVTDWRWPQNRRKNG
jgi:hypothetical protein